MREVMEGDADQWRLYLIGQGLANNTVRRRCGMAKQFFRVAVRRKLILSNPFEDLKASVKGNAERLYFISRQEAGKVLEACPSVPSGGLSLLCAAMGALDAPLSFYCSRGKMLTGSGAGYEYTHPRRNITKARNPG